MSPLSSVSAIEGGLEELLLVFGLRDDEALDGGIKTPLNELRDLVLAGVTTVISSPESESGTMLCASLDLPRRDLLGSGSGVANGKAD